MPDHTGWLLLLARVLIMLFSRRTAASHKRSGFRARMTFDVRWDHEDQPPLSR